MKKSIIALAVAGAMTVPMVAQADATLFGSVRYDITDVDGKTHVDSEINRVRIGVKGEETMDNGLTAGYFVRFASSTDATGTVEASNGNLGVDKLALYVAGDFGKIILGDADSPVQYAEGRQTYTAVYDGSLEVAGSEFTNGGISYESNVISGFQFRVGLGDIDGGDTGIENANENSWGVGVSYGNDLFDIAAGFGEERLGSAAGTNTVGTTAADEVGVYGIGAQIKFANGAVGVAFSEKEDYAQYTSVSGKYSIDKLTLAAQYEVRDTDLAGSADQKAFNVSASYDLGGNASVTLGAVDFNAGAGADKVKLRYAVSF